MAGAARIITAVAALILTSALSGCGFKPLYATPGYQGLPGLEIDAPSDRFGYLLEDALRDHLGGGRSEYRVEIQTRVTEVALGLSAAGRARRFRSDNRIIFLLTGPENFRYAGSVTEAVFYDAPSDPYALIVARAAAEERAAEQIADRLVREFAAAFERVNSGLEP